MPPPNHEPASLPLTLPKTPRARARALHPPPRPPAPPAGPAPLPGARRPVLAPPAPHAPAPAAPPFPGSAGSRPQRAPRRPACPAAAGPARPPRPAPRAGPAAPSPTGASPRPSLRRGGGRRGHRRRCSSVARSRLRRRLLLAAFLRHLVEERHQLLGELGRHAGDLVHVLALELEDVLEGAVPRLLQHVHELRGEPLQLAQRDLGGRLLFGRQRREQRTLAASLQPLAARVQVDLPRGELGREAHVLPVAADGE